MNDTKVVQFANVARNLVKLGYRIIDLKPKKENHSQSLYIFAVEGNFTSDFDRLMKQYSKTSNK